MKAEDKLTLGQEAHAIPGGSIIPLWWWGGGACGCPERALAVVALNPSPWEQEQERSRPRGWDAQLGQQ